ncbi:MAG: hypothetical protein ACREON_05280 [Gemmatimonadaceae bacterium]
MTARRRLWTATLVSILAGIACLYLDRAAVSAGHRSWIVATVAAGLFAILFGALAYPIVRVVQGWARSAGARPAAPSVPAFCARFDVPVLLLGFASVPAIMFSPNDFGYRLKGAGRAAPGAAFDIGRGRRVDLILSVVLVLCVGLIW